MISGIVNATPPLAGAASRCGPRLRLVALVVAVGAVNAEQVLLDAGTALGVFIEVHAQAVGAEFHEPFG